MRYNSRKNIYRAFILALALMSLTGSCLAKATPPDGLMLNLDFQNVENGLIPSKTLYPLYTPLGNLGIETIHNRSMLAFQFGQGLSIPHSSLLDPDGREWVISVRAFVLSDGIILSQSNHQVGCIIYIKDGVVHAAVTTGASTFTLTESPTRGGTTDCINSWITIELQIKPDMAILILNRKRCAMAQLSTPLTGDKLHVRLGNHRSLPRPFNYIKQMAPDGFTGAISSLKFIRQ